MDFRSILHGLEQGLAVVDKLKPFAALGGPQVAAIATVVGGLADTARELIKHGEDAATLVTTTDLDKAREIQAKLQAENDELGKLVDAS